MARQGALLELSRCPHCNIDQPNLQSGTYLSTTNFRGNYERNWQFYVCSRCGGVISAWSAKGSPEIQQMYPAPMQVDEAIPSRAKEYLEQAITSISAPAGSVMLTSSAVDSMLKAKGLAEGSLYSRINSAVTSHLITSEMATWAHEIRLDANDQRHADDAASLPSEDDAKRVIDFAQALGMFLFVLPARVLRGIQGAHEK